jgi:hypothetical protein
MMRTPVRRVIHLEVARITEKGHGEYIWVLCQGACGSCMNEATKKHTLDVTVVSCRLCRRQARYRKRVAYLDATVRAGVAVLLDWFLDHEKDIALPPDLQGLERRLRRRGLNTADLAVEPARETGFILEAEALAARFGQARLDQIVKSGDLRQLRQLTLLPDLAPREQLALIGG